MGTTLVLGELHSHLLYLRGPREARAVLLHLLDDPVHEWVEVPASLVREAVVTWLARYPDQHFSSAVGVILSCWEGGWVATAS